MKTNKKSIEEIRNKYDGKPVYDVGSDMWYLTNVLSWQDVDLYEDDGVRFINQYGIECRIGELIGPLVYPCYEQIENVERRE